MYSSPICCVVSCPLPATSIQSEVPAKEVFSHFPKPADYPFAKATERAGEDFGGEFAYPDGIPATIRSHRSMGEKG